MLPLSTNHEELLMECHERVVLKQPPLSLYYFKYGKGLLKRGLVELTRFFKNGKAMIGVVITKSGIEYLNEQIGDQRPETSGSLKN